MVTFEQTEKVSTGLDVAIKGDQGNVIAWTYSEDMARTIVDALNNFKRYAELKEVAFAMREWIDAVPDDVQLPVMPGHDRDWAGEILGR